MTREEGPCPEPYCVYYANHEGEHRQEFLVERLAVAEMTIDPELAIRELRRLGYIIKDPLPPPPVQRCLYCGNTDDLIDVTVEVAHGEEGYARVERYVCDGDLVMLTAQLIDLGFGTHAHGGICFLEVTKCPGFTDMDQCPTPEDQYPQ